MTRARALIKKQLAEVFAWLYRDMKKGTRRTGAALVLYGVLYAVMYTALGAMFYGMGMMLSPMIEAGYAWLYMALTGLVGLFMGVFGSVFNTYATLYNAKDNELMLSLPVPTRLILASRLTGVCAIGLLYELIVMIPTNIVYLIHAKPGVLGVIFTLIIPIVLSFIVLGLSCILGWVVALIASRLMRNPTMNRSPTAARTAETTSSPNRIRFSSEPPYSSVRWLRSGVRNAWMR